MNALDLITEQHKEIDARLARLPAIEDPDEKQREFDALADRLAAHMAIKEEIFYPAVRVTSTFARLDACIEEQVGIKRLLADLLGLDPTETTFEEKLKLLGEKLSRHHTREEEHKLFPEISKMLSREQLEALGGEMESLFAELLSGQPRERITSELEETAHP